MEVSKKVLFALVASGDGLYTPKENIPAYCNKKTAAVIKHRHRANNLGDETYDAIAFHFGFSKETIYTKR